VLYIESPAGVGYSLAGTEADTIHNDMSTSVDALAALNHWYVKFPEYVNNKLWISGESYGGIYVPYLAWQIHQNNLKYDMDKRVAMHIPLQGILVGNGATTWDYDNSPSIPVTAVDMGLVPVSLLEEWNTNGCIFYFRDVKPSGGVNCGPIWDKMSASFNDLNIYDFFRTNEVSNTAVEDRMGKSMVNGEEKTYKRGMTQAEYTPWLKHLVNDSNLMYTSLTDYMNDEKVRTALHIPASAPGWEQCSGPVGNAYQLQQEASLWIYGVLRNNGIKMLFYSGETDGAIPTYGTKEWMKDLRWEVTSPWTPWIGAD
jgi:carboxypeptidase C (cathepsin A)